MKYRQGLKLFTLTVQRQKRALAREFHRELFHLEHLPSRGIYHRNIREKNPMIQFKRNNIEMSSRAQLRQHVVKLLLHPVHEVIASST